MRFEDTGLTLAALPYRFCSAPVEINFPAANVPREVLHGCASVPDDCVLGLSPEGARITRAAGKQWSNSTAWLQSDLAGSTVRVFFVLYREAPRNVQPTS